MTNEERKVFELALEWIQKQPEETLDSKYDVDTRYVVIRELEAALAQPEQEGGVCGRCGGWVSDPVITQPKQETVAVEFEKMTGVPNAWNNPALMQVRNGFIGGWEAAQSKKSENFDTWMKNPYTKTIMESIKNDYQPKKPKNEPVAWYDKDGVITANPIEFSQPLYTTPPQPEKPDQDEVDIRSRLYQRIHEIETQLAQPEQEPVANVVLFEGAGKLLEFKKGNYIHGAKVEHIPLYTTPPQRKPLTNEYLKRVIYEHTKLNPNLRDDQELIGYIINAIDVVISEIPQRKPLNDEMRKQMKKSFDSDNMEMRGAFIDGWTSAEAAHGIKE